MALAGVIEDFKLEKYLDDLKLEIQQKTSLLWNAVTHVEGGGFRTHETKMGKLGTYNKTQRGQLKQAQDGDFERRIYEYETIASDYRIDKIDQLNSAGDLLRPALESMRAAMGRRIDTHIIGAIKGSPLKTVNGSSSGASFLAANQIAVGENKFDSNGSTETSFTLGKLQHALAILEANDYDTSVEDIFVIGSYTQLAQLGREIKATSADYVSKKPLEIPGLVPGIQGFMGCNFISSNLVGKNIVGDEDAVYVYVKSAVKCATRIPLMVTQSVEEDRVLHPTMISAATDLGAIRLFDEGVVEVSCLAVTL